MKLLQFSTVLPALYTVDLYITWNVAIEMVCVVTVVDYSYPFIVIVVSMVTNAVHFSHFRRQVS